MDRIVILNFVVGDFHQGFTVTVQMGSDSTSLSAGIQGELPPCPELPRYYQRWQQVYHCLFSRAIKAQPGINRASLSLDTTADAAEKLRKELNTWLNSPQFRVIQHRLREALHRDETIRVLLQTDNSQLRKLPWHLWDFFERYPHAELALSTSTFEQPPIVPPREKARILAILGNSEGIDVAQDCQLLQEKLADAEIVFLVEPSRRELDEQLWDDLGWDILFFAGHGETEGETGIIYINSTESLTITQLNKALKTAIKRGLRLAIFNCCDGLGLARQLSDLHLPQVIVMREPVADRVAQDFLKYFLHAFASGQHLYMAVRQARERLQGIENEIPCASWLPVLCQNPAVSSPKWVDLGSVPRCPYKGLSAFQQEDQSVFFGREAFTQQLVEAVNNKPLVAIIGPSGRGKSSVVFAGLIPHLLVSKDRWQIADFRPGVRPFDALAAALLMEVHTGDRLAQIHQLAAKLRTSKFSLTKFITEIQNPQSIVLIVDQFEELYTLCPNFKERERFLDCLLTAVSDAPGFKLVLTLRSDFYGYAQSYRPFNDALQDNCLNLGPMNEQELREAIAFPASSCGVNLEAGLVERILNDVGKKPKKYEDSVQKSPPDKLPLLEFTLKQLWAEATKQGIRQLTNQAYDKIGGIQKALGTYAEEVYNRIVKDYEAKQIRRVFTQLVRPGETTATEHTRRLATRQEIGAENWELVTRLNREDVRLVVIGYDEATCEETVEVVHEALIRGWERLKDWLNSDRAFRTWQERLRLAVREWDQSSHDEDDLLSGARLVEAENWLEKRSEDLSSAERQFIEKGLELREGKRLEEENRRKRELEAARQLAQESEARRKAEEEARQNAEKRAEEQARASKAAQIMNFVAFIAILFVSAAAIFVSLQWNKAQLQSQNLKLIADSKTASEMLELDGLIASLKVGRELQKLQNSGNADEETRIQVLKALQHMVDSEREKNRLHGHRHKINNVSFSPDELIIATASTDKTVKLWRRDGGLITTLRGHSNSVEAVSFSSDGQMIATASRDKTVKLWRRDGSIITTLIGHDDQVRGVAFSPDGQAIATASADKTVKLWRRDGSLISTLRGHGDQVYAVNFSSKGELATASADKTVKLWQRDGGLIKTLRGHGDRVYAVSFSPNGEMLASASEDNTVKLWKRNGSQIATLTGHRYRVNSVSFSPDGEMLASASRDNTVKLWRLDGSLMTTLTGHSNEVNSVSFSPKGETIATASTDTTVKLWKLNYSIGHKAPVWDLDFSPNDKTIISGSEDKTIKLWNHDGSWVDTLKGHSAGVTDVDFSFDGKMIISGSEDKTVKLWYHNGKKLIKVTTFRGHTAGVTGVIFTKQNGQIIAASTSKDKTIKLWRLDGSLITTLHGHSAEVSDISFSWDGLRMASASWDNTIKLWRKQNGRWINYHTLTGHTAAVNDVTFSRDGKTIASASADKTIKIWRQDGRLIATLKGHSAGVTDVNFSRNGETIISASDDKSIKLWKWDGRNAGLMTTLFGHSAGVTDINPTDDGHIFASASADGTVILWNLNLDLKLEDLLKRGCSLAQDYLQNPHNGMSKNDQRRRLCEQVK